MGLVGGAWPFLAGLLWQRRAQARALVDAADTPPTTHSPALQRNPTPSSTLHLKQKMVFFQQMGAMNSDVPVLGQEFNTWFPATMVIYVALLTLNWWERCCSRIFITNRFRFEAVRWEGGGGGERLREAALVGTPVLLLWWLGRHGAG